MKESINNQDRVFFKWLMNIRWHLGAYNVDYLKFFEYKITPETIEKVSQLAAKEGGYWDDWMISVGSGDNFNSGDKCPSLTGLLPIQDGNILASELYMQAISHIRNTFTQEVLLEISGLNAKHLDEGYAS